MESDRLPLLLSMIVLVLLAVAIYKGLSVFSYTSIGAAQAINPPVFYVEGSVGTASFNVNRTSVNVSLSLTGTSSSDVYAVFAESGATNPYYSVWSPGAGWSTPSAVTAITLDYDVTWVRGAGSPASPEKVIAVQTDNPLTDTGTLYAAVWDGTAWGNAVTLATNLPAIARRFDVAYVYNTSAGGWVAVVAYRDPAVADNDVCIRIWNGTAWSAEQPLGLNLADASGNIMYVLWVRLCPSPDGKQLVLLIEAGNPSVGSLYLYATVWRDGQGWTPVTVLSTSLASNAYQCFDGAWDANQTLCLVAWGDAAGYVYYAWWDGTSWSTTQTASWADSDALYWVQVVPDPAGNYIALVAIDDGIDVGSIIFSVDPATASVGIAEPAIQFDTSAETIYGKCISCGWESLIPGHTHHCIAVYGDGATTSYVHWDPVNGWSTPTVIAGTDDTPVVEMTYSSDGELIALCWVITGTGKNRAYNLYALVWDGSAWTITTLTTSLSFPDGTYFCEPFFPVPDRYASYQPTSFDFIVQVNATQNMEFVVKLTSYSIDPSISWFNVTAYNSTYSSLQVAVSPSQGAVQSSGDPIIVNQTVPGRIRVDFDPGFAGAGSSSTLYLVVEAWEPAVPTTIVALDLKVTVTLS